MGDIYKALREEEWREKESNRKQAGNDFERARDKARASGFDLVRHTEQHYQIRKGWILDLYPGNQRIYSNPKAHPRAPRIKTPVGRCWGLMDIVTDIIESERRLAK